MPVITTNYVRWLRLCFSCWMRYPELRLSNTRFHPTHLLLTAIKATLYVLTLHHLSPSSSILYPQTVPCRFAASLIGHHSPALIPHSLWLPSSLPPPSPKTEQRPFLLKSLLLSHLLEIICSKPLRGVLLLAGQPPWFWFWLLTFRSLKSIQKGC